MATASPTAVWGALFVVYVVWGSTYLAIRVVVETAPPLLSMGLRFVAAGALVAGVFALRRGFRSLAVTRRELAAAGLVGALLLLGGNGLVAIAEQTVPSGLAALLVSATPLWLVCLRVVMRDRPGAMTWVGTAVGFGGIALLTLPGSQSGDVELWGVLVVIAATVSWALGSFFSSRLPLPENPFVATIWEMLLGGLALLVAGVGAGEVGGLDLGAVAPEAWFALAYLVTFGSIAAFSAYVWLLGNAPISLVATYAYVNPVVAVVLGALILDERITVPILVGGAIVVAGVALVVSTERPRRAARVEPVPETEPAAPRVVGS